MLGSVDFEMGWGANGYFSSNVLISFKTIFFKIMKKVYLFKTITIRTVTVWKTFLEIYYFVPKTDPYLKVLLFISASVFESIICANFNRIGVADPYKIDSDRRTGRQSDSQTDTWVILKRLRFLRMIGTLKITHIFMMSSCYLTLTYYWQ